MPAKSLAVERGDLCYRHEDVRPRMAWCRDSGECPRRHGRIVSPFGCSETSVSNSKSGISTALLWCKKATRETNCAVRCKYSRQGLTRVIGRPRRFGENHATAAGSILSNRAAHDCGAIVCTNCSISRGRLCGKRSALYGIDLFRKWCLPLTKGRRPPPKLSMTTEVAAGFARSAMAAALASSRLR